MIYLKTFHKEDFQKKAFLFPEKLQISLKKITPTNLPYWVVIAKNEEKEVIGWVIATPEENSFSKVSARIVNFTIIKGKPEEVGKKLLTQMCIQLKKAKFSRVEILLYSDEKISEYFNTLKSIIERLNWSPLNKIYTSFVINLRNPEIPSQSWYKLVKLTDGYELFLWKDLRKEEHEYLLKIKKQLENKDYYLDPLKINNYYEPISFGLRNKKEKKVIGWMFTQIFDKDTIALHRMYILPEERGRGFWPAIFLRRCIERARINFSKLTFFVTPQNDFVRKKFQKILTPIIENKINWYIAEKDL